MNECLLCNLQSETPEIYWEKNEFWVIRHAEEEKKIPGYFILECKNHIVTYEDISIDSLREYGEIVHRTVHWILNHLKPLKIYILTISEKVPHIHYHIVPRYQDEMIGIPYIQTVTENRYLGSVNNLEEKWKIVSDFREKKMNLSET